jgi:hypothetical protein
MNDDVVGLIIILAIISIAAFGGVKNIPRGPSARSQTVATTSSDPQKKLEDLKQQLQVAQDAEKQSVYKGAVSIAYVNRGSKASDEYVTLKMSGSATSTVLITGWTLKSLSSGTSVTIPKATYLFFANNVNSENPVYLENGDTVYLNTGYSPNGASFKVNKCSGYLSQFQTFVPYLQTSCPLPRNEDLSSIPGRVINDACFDYIDSLPACKIQTENLPSNWTYECDRFITTKINYPTCVDNHKNDKDFNNHEWRIYLNRSTLTWKERRETIVLYDTTGKIVDTLKY